MKCGSEAAPPTKIHGKVAEWLKATDCKVRFKQINMYNIKNATLLTLQRKLEGTIACVLL
jgi:hypothetical protein